MSDGFIVWFDDYSEADRLRVGGKVASLGEMMAAELPVPPGFAVTTAAYETLKEDPHLTTEVGAALAEVDYAKPVELRQISSHVRSLIESVPIRPDIEEFIRSAYAQLCDVANAKSSVRERPSIAGRRESAVGFIGQNVQSQATEIIQSVSSCGPSSHWYMGRPDSIESLLPARNPRGWNRVTPKSRSRRRPACRPGSAVGTTAAFSAESDPLILSH